MPVKNLEFSNVDAIKRIGEVLDLHLFKSTGVFLFFFVLLFLFLVVSFIHTNMLL